VYYWFIFTAWRYIQEEWIFPLYVDNFIFYLITIIIIDIIDHCYLLICLLLLYYFYLYLSCAYFLFYCRCIITDTWRTLLWRHNKGAYHLVLNHHIQLIIIILCSLILITSMPCVFLATENNECYFPFLSLGINRKWV